MTRAEAFTESEEAIWRALLRIVIALPRALDADLMRSTGLTMTEMLVLISLVDAPKRQLRMSHLADVTALSASRVTRIVADLQRRGFVDKRVCDEDGRGYIAELTPQGRAEVKRTHPGRLRNAREHVIDHLDPAELPVILKSLTQILDGLEPTRDRDRVDAQ
jgi:DNA-binding MarR family transcriptional regulator